MCRKAFSVAYKFSILCRSNPWPVGAWFVMDARNIRCKESCTWACREAARAKMLCWKHLFFATSNEVISGMHFFCRTCFWFVLGRLFVGSRLQRLCPDCTACVPFSFLNTVSVDLFEGSVGLEMLGLSWLVDCLIFWARLFSISCCTLRFASARLWC